MGRGRGRKGSFREGRKRGRVGRELKWKGKREVREGRERRKKGIGRRS